MLVLHLVQPAMAAFFPFCAAILGRYPTNHLSQVIYVGCIMIYRWSSAIECLLAGRGGALETGLSLAMHRRFQSRNLRGAIVVTVLLVFLSIRTLTA